MLIFFVPTPTFNLMYSLIPFNLIQIVKFGTHINRSSASLLDLIFLSAAYFLYSCSALPPLGNSDHIGLQLLVQVKNLKRKQGNQHIFCGITIRAILQKQNA